MATAFALESTLRALHLFASRGRLGVELGKQLRYGPAEAALDFFYGDARGEGRNVALQFLQGHDVIVIGQYVPAYAERLAELDER